MSTSTQNVKPNKRQCRWSGGKRIGAFAAAAVALLLIGALAGCQSGEEAPATDQTPLAAEAPENTVNARAEEVATGFLEAYGALDVEQAMTYLADDATIASIGAQDDLPLLIAYLEATGSLCLDDAARVAYAALSPRTDRGLLAEWGRRLGYRVVSFTATDAGGVPYYHTNVMMFLAHGLAVVCLESIADPAERARVEAALAGGGFEIVPITRAQLLAFCGNGLALTSDRGEPLIAMSTAAFHGFTPIERARLENRARILHTDLSAFEKLGGGSARCLLGELV